MDSGGWDRQVGIHDSSDEDEGAIAWFWERASGQDSVRPSDGAALAPGGGLSPPAAPAFREEGSLSFSPPENALTDAARRAEPSPGRRHEDRERRSRDNETAAVTTSPDAVLAGWSSRGAGSGLPGYAPVSGAGHAEAALLSAGATAELHLASAEDAANSVAAGTTAQNAAPVDGSEFASGLALEAKAPTPGSDHSPLGLGIPQSGHSSESDSFDSWGDGGAEVFAALAPPRRPQGIAAWRVDSRYSLQRGIGKGAYGEVAVAWDSVVRRHVAIKRLHGVFKSPEDIERVYREIFLLRRLRHSNVIRLHDILCDGGDGGADGSGEDTELYLVFEYADTDLYHLLQSPQYLTADHVRTFLYQLAHAMRYMHARGTVHRDLKPANILVNEDCTLRVCDLGLARTLPRGNEGRGPPQTGQGPAPAASPPPPGGTTAEQSAAPAPVPAPLPAAALVTIHQGAGPAGASTSAGLSTPLLPSISPGRQRVSAAGATVPLDSVVDLGGKQHPHEAHAPPSEHGSAAHAAMRRALLVHPVDMRNGGVRTPGAPLDAGMRAAAVLSQEHGSAEEVGRGGDAPVVVPQAQSAGTATAAGTPALALGEADQSQGTTAFHQRGGLEDAVAGTGPHAAGVDLGAGLAAAQDPAAPQQPSGPAAPTSSGSHAARQGRRRKRHAQGAAPAAATAASGGNAFAPPPGRKRRRRPAARDVARDEEEAEVAALTAMAQTAAHLSAGHSGHSAVASAQVTGPTAAAASPALPGGLAISSPAWDAGAAAARGGGGGDGNASGSREAQRPRNRGLLTVRDVPEQGGLGGGRHRRRKTRLRRGLTMHVVTRWYRAPEIVLQQEYGPKVDVWSAGCVFAELLGMQKENARTHMSRRPLFPGGPTPQSELPDMSKDPFEGDQMATILSVVGTPSADVLAALPAHSRDMLRGYRFQPGRRLCDLYPGADAKALDLLEAMLRFSPSRRPSFEEVLRHPYFAGMQGAGAEGVDVAAPIEMPDVSECGVLELRRLIMAEANSVHADAMVELAGNE